VRRLSVTTKEQGLTKRQVFGSVSLLDPSCIGGGGRENHDLKPQSARPCLKAFWKITKAKRAEGMTQLVKHLLRRTRTWAQTPVMTSAPLHPPKKAPKFLVAPSWTSSL
jgi:hypothetical protein